MIIEFGLSIPWNRFLCAQSRLTLCNPMDCSPPDSSVHGIFFFLTLQYCIGFDIYQHESSTGIHVFPILNPPPPTSLPVASLWVILVHQPQASSIMHRTWTGDSFHIWYYTCFSMPFSQIIPPFPSPIESKRLFYTSVSLLLSRTQGYCYHLSKFHIYALVYCRFSHVRLCATP